MKNSFGPLSKRGKFLVGSAILLAVFLVALDSIARSTSIRVTSSHNLGTPPPAFDPASPTGYELGMRCLVLPTAGTDGYQWIMHAQEMLKQGNWRIRFTDQDNAPTGREIHWSHSFIWWLVGVGKIHSLLTGWPLPASVEAVAPWANTLFLVILILALPWVVYRFFGTIPACVSALALPATYTFYEFFAVGYPDHHGLTGAAASLAVLFAGLGAAGWVFTPRVKLKHSEDTGFFPPNVYALAWPRARLCFTASAVAGAVSLWISAATATPALLGVAAGGVLSLIFLQKPAKGDQTRYEAGIWRHWGIVGCAMSLGFYLLEYFPSNLGLRLEVNHPLYALAWLGGGEIITRLAEWRLKGVPPWVGRGRCWSFVLALIGVVLLPLVVIAFREQVFLVADPFLWQLHKDYINEFKTLLERVRLESVGSLIVLIGVLPLLSLGVIRLLSFKDLDRTWKTMLLVTTMPALFVTLLSFGQIRWTGIANALWLAVLPVWLACFLTPAVRLKVRLPERLACFGFFLLLLVPHPMIMLGSFGSSLALNPVPPPDEAFGMVTRELAHMIRRRTQGQPVTILGGPTSTTWMMYFGGFKGVGTLYWENLEGLKSAAAIYEANSDEKALGLLKKHHITHIAIFSMDPFVHQYPRLVRGLPLGVKSFDAFIPKIFERFIIPKWVNPVFCALPDTFRSQWIALFEVKPDQPESEWELAFGRFYADKQEWPAAAQHLKKTLILTPEQTAVRRELARALFLSGQNIEARTEFDAGIAGMSATESTEWSFALAADCHAAGWDEGATFLLRRALAISPAATGAKNSLAWVLATSKLRTVREPREALALALGNTQMGSKFGYYNTLAAAYAANRQFDEAVTAAERALVEARAEGLSASEIDLATKQLDFYRTGGEPPLTKEP